MEANDVTGDVTAPEHAGPGAVPTRPEAVQDRLPFDLDEPIPYALTARARRVVAPRSLPELTVLPTSAPTPAAPPPDGEDEGPDMRPARARALRRAGTSLRDIAGELDVTELTVEVWVGDVDPVRSAQRRLRAVDGSAIRALPRVPPDTPSSEATGDDRAGGPADFDPGIREQAASVGHERLASDPRFASGLGVVAGTAELNPHAIVLTSRDPRMAGASLTWLLTETGAARGRVRAVVRMAPQLPGDLVRHRWATALGIPPDQVVGTPWRAAPTADASEAMIRLADPVAAATVVGWRDALLGRMAIDAPDTRP